MHPISRKDFQLWLDQEVWVSGCTKALRRDWIPAFVEELTRRMNRLGYRMNANWRQGELVFAKWLYLVHCSSRTQPWETDNRLRNYYANMKEHRDWPEDRDRFSAIVTLDTLEQLLDVYREIEDLSQELPLGQLMLSELPYFLYTWVDLDRSKQGDIVARMFGDTTSDSDDEKWHPASKKADDIYLEEAKQGFHGGRGSKV